MLEKKILKLEIDFGVGDTKKAQNEINGGLKGIDAMLEKIKNKWKGIFTHSPSVNVNGLESTSRTLAEIKREYSEVTKEIDRLNKKIEENDAKSQSLYEQEKRLTAEHKEAPASASEAGAAWKNGVAGADKEQEDWLEKARQIKNELDGIKKKSGELDGATQGFYNQIDKAKDKAEQLKKEMAQASFKTNEMKNNSSKTSGAFDGVSKSVDRFGTRLRSIVSGAMVFNAISAGLRSVSQYLGSALSANTQFASSLASVKGNLMTAFQPIYNAVLPALTSLMNGLSKAAAYAAAFVSSLFGGSYKQSQAQAKALNGKIAASKKTSGGGGKSGKSEQEKAIDNEIKAIEKKIKALQKENKQIRKNEQAQKKLNKQNEKSEADFDNLHILEENKAEEENPDIEANENEIEALQEQLDLLNEKKQALAEMNTGGGGAGSGSNEILPDFSGDIDTAIFDDLKSRLEGILTIVGLIGGGLLAWKISEMTPEALSKLGSTLQTIGGIIAIIAGTILTLWGYSDMWVNGISWQNFLVTIGGLAALITGIALAVSPMAAVWAAVGAGIALVVVGVRDFIANGATFKNILTIIIGLGTLFAATWVLASLPIAALVTGIAALVAGFVILWNKCEPFREFWIGLWEAIQTAAQSAWDNFLLPVLTAIWDKISEIWNNCISPLWTDHLQPLFTEVGTALKDMWDNFISPFFSKLGEIVGWLWDNILSPLLEKINGRFVSEIRDALSMVQNIFSTVFTFLGGFIDAFKQNLVGIITFLTGVFTGDFEKAWNGIVSIAKGIANALVTTLEGVINLIIDGINFLIRKVNNIIESLGDTIGISLSIPTIPQAKLPRLAKGTVVPPNREFLAVLGDNKKETEIVSPMSTMKQAFKEALQEMGGFSQSGDTALYINGREFARAVMSDFQYELNRKGTKLVKGGAY